MSVKVKYKGEEILSLNTDTEKALATEGQYCEADILIQNTQDGGITPSGSITLTEERSYDVTDKATAVVDFSTTRANLAEAVTAKGVDTLPTSSFDTIATNIGLIGGGGGLPSSITKIDGGSFTPTSDEYTSLRSISHSLGVNPQGVVIWTENFSFLTPPSKADLQVGFATFVEGSSGNSGAYLQVRQGAGSTSSSTNASTIATSALGSWVTSSTFVFVGNATRYRGGTTYKWIAWA